MCRVRSPSICLCLASSLPVVAKRAQIEREFNRDTRVNCRATLHQPSASTLTRRCHDDANTKGRATELQRKHDIDDLLFRRAPGNCNT